MTKFYFCSVNLLFQIQCCTFDVFIIAYVSYIVIGFIILYKRFGECSSKDPIMLSPIHIKQFSKSERLCVNRKTRLE